MHEAAQTFNASPEGLTKLDAHYWVNILTLLFICHLFFVFSFCPPQHLYVLANVVLEISPPFQQLHLVFHSFLIFHHPSDVSSYRYSHKCTIIVII